jgi:glycosyltransferase involved in cell wall biosynthesis
LKVVGQGEGDASIGRQRMSFLASEGAVPAKEFLLSAPQDWSEAPAGSNSGVSVILRTRDRPEFLRRAVENIGAQTFRDIGVWVVNDGGDVRETEDIVKRGLPSSVAIDFIHNPTSVGRPSALNLAFAKVDREFFCVHDDDDTWSERFLATMVGYLRQPSGAQYIGVACDTDTIVESLIDGRIVQHTRRPHRRDRGTLSLFEALNFFSHPPPISLLTRSRALALVPRNNSAMSVMYDCEWLARLLLIADVGAIPSVLAFYHLREQDDDELGAARNAIFEHGEEFHRLRTLLENELFRDDIAAGRPGLGFALSFAHRWVERDRHSLNDEGVRFVERKAKAYFRRKTLRRRIKNAMLGAIGRKPPADSPL